MQAKVSSVEVWIWAHWAPAHSGLKGCCCFPKAYNKTRQIKERLREAACHTEVHSLKVMHCEIAFLFGVTFILLDGCSLSVSANRLSLCVCGIWKYFVLFNVSVQVHCRFAKACQGLTPTFGNTMIKLQIYTLNPQKNGTNVCFLQVDWPLRHVLTYTVLLLPC